MLSQVDGWSSGSEYDISSSEGGDDLSSDSSGSSDEDEEDEEDEAAAAVSSGGPPRRGESTARRRGDRSAAQGERTGTLDRDDLSEDDAEEQDGGKLCAWEGSLAVGSVLAHPLGPRPILCPLTRRCTTTCPPADAAAIHGFCPPSLYARRGRPRRPAHRQAVSDLALSMLVYSCPGPPGSFGSAVAVNRKRGFAA